MTSGEIKHVIGKIAELSEERDEALTKLQVATEALEYCRKNNFKIEKTQEIARAALEKIKNG